MKLDINDVRVKMEMKYFSRNFLVQEEIKRKISKYHETDEIKNITYPNLLDPAKTTKKNICRDKHLCQKREKDFKQSNFIPQRTEKNNKMRPKLSEEKEEKRLEQK